MKLSILIPTITKRSELFKGLFAELNLQITDLGATNEVEILWDNSDVKTIGEKRNSLLARASGKYTAFIDDDDEVYEYYLSELLMGIASGPDCISLHGIMTTNGANPEHFEHSIKYKEYRTTDNKIKYERYPNHLNCIRASIAKQFPFPSINHGEDTAFATQVFKSGLLKQEYYLDKVLYHYRYITKK